MSDDIDEKDIWYTVRDVLPKGAKFALFFQYGDDLSVPGAVIANVPHATIKAVLKSFLTDGKLISVEEADR